MLTLESLPIGIPWIPGASVVIDLGNALDLTSKVYSTLTAPFVAEEQRIGAARAALEALDPPPPDTEAQLAALVAADQANNDALFQCLAVHLIRRIEGITPVPIPGQPETWEPIHPALRDWLIGGTVLREARQQLQAPFTELRSAMRSKTASSAP